VDDAAATANLLALLCTGLATVTGLTRPAPIGRHRPDPTALRLSQ